MGNYYNNQISFGPPITRAVKMIIFIFIGVDILLFLTNSRLVQTDFFSSLLVLSVEKLNSLYLHQLLTYSFVNIGFLSLLFNSLMLWMFGSKLEELWGEKNFIFFYLASTFTGGLLTWIIFSIYNVAQPVWGASSALFGIYVMYALLWPDREVLLFLVIPIKMKFLMPIIMLFSLLSLGNTSYIADLGGAIFGLAYFYLNRKHGLSFDFSFSRFLQRRRMRKYQEEMFEKINAKDRVDELLDKISKHGMRSLTKKEKQFLKEASDSYYGDETKS
jgi:membrane associated rhomboid family serine protease